MDAGLRTSCPPPTSPHPHFQSTVESRGFHGSHGAWSSEVKCAWRRKEIEAVGVAGFLGYPHPFQGAHSALLWTQRSRSLILFAGGQSFPLEKLTPLRLVSSNPRSLYGHLVQGFPGGPVVKNSPVNTRDTGSIPGPGRSHMLWSN